MKAGMNDGEVLGQTGSSGIANGSMGRQTSIESVEGKQVVQDRMNWYHE